MTMAIILNDFSDHVHSMSTFFLHFCHTLQQPQHLTGLGLFPGHAVPGKGLLKSL